MDKRVLQERMRKKQQQLRRRKMMKLGGYILAVVLVAVFIIKGVILPITNKISGKDADKPVRVEADAGKTADAEKTEPKKEEVKTDGTAAIRMPLASVSHITTASDLTSGWHKDENGKWYQNTDGTYYAGGMQEIDGQTYSFDDNGYIQTGWVSQGFDDLYFNEDGAYNPEKHKPRIALTFDDGPGEYTDQLLDCLEKNNAHATFFMLGQNVGSWESTVKRMTDIGCELGNHSWDHPEATLQGISDEAVIEEFQKTDEALMKACGQKSTVARAPYGAAAQREFDLVQKPFFMWSLDTLDWKTLNVESTVDAVMNGDLTDGSIILMHDIHEPSVQAALQIIPQLVEKGYKLMTVSELAAAKGVKLQNASYADFWDSSLSKGLVAGYDGPLLSAEAASGSEGGEGSVSDGSSEDSYDEGSDMSDGSSEDGSGEEYSDESGDASYDDEYYGDGSDEEYY